MIARLFVGSVGLLLASSANAASLTAAEASGHVGENATVCGVVASSKYAATSRSQPTFLNIDKPYPDEPFTVVIFGSDRPKFGQPDVALQGKRVCATGKIQLYRGKPEVVVHDPGQITQ